MKHREPRYLLDPDNGPFCAECDVPFVPWVVNPLSPAARLCPNCYTAYKREGLLSRNDPGPCAAERLDPDYEPMEQTVLLETQHHLMKNRNLPGGKEKNRDRGCTCYTCTHGFMAKEPRRNGMEHGARNEEERRGA